MSVLKAIRAKCLDCCGQMPSEVKDCHIETCALHPYRLGTNPFRKKRTLTDEQKKVLADRLAQAREARK